MCKTPPNLRRNYLHGQGNKDQKEKHQGQNSKQFPPADLVR